MKTMAINTIKVGKIGGEPLPTIRQIIAVSQDQTNIGSNLDFSKIGIERRKLTWLESFIWFDLFTHAQGAPTTDYFTNIFKIFVI